MGAFSIEISEHMHNNSEKRDEVDIQVAFLGKIICVFVMTLTSVYSDICVLIMTLMSVNW